MSSITFEYPLAFTLLIIFFICSRWCKARGLAIYFPNISLLQKASKKSSLLINSLKLLIVILLTTALASPIREDSVVVKNDKGYRF